MSALEEEENGWGSDDDILDQIVDEDGDAWKEDGAATPITTNRRVATVEVDGWDDDDLDDLEDDNEEEGLSKNVTSSLQIPLPPPLPKTSMSKTTTTPLERELEEYIASIPDSIAQVNRRLSTQYNTREKAIELQHYYASRPQLLQYTLEKEFPRMEYTLRLQKNGPLLKDKTIMAQVLPQHDSHSLCGRCANQSLLVDVLQAMSSETGIQRTAVLPSRFMASSIATSCHFTIDLPASTVHVHALFQISLPLPTAGRWILGQLPATIDFYCPNPSSSQPLLPPNVEFRVLDWMPTVLGSEHDVIRFRTQLQQCAAFLQEHQDMVHFDDEVDNNDMLPSDARFRDVFLQRLSSSTTEGLQSAWQDLDAATGLVSKLQHIPSLLPSPLMEEEAEAVVAPRPTSLWGGLVRTIAQSLPTEPEVYDDPDLMAPVVKEAPRLYNRRPEPPPNVTLALQLYNNRPEPPPNVAPVPRLYNNRPEPSAEIEAHRLYGSLTEPPKAPAEPLSKVDHRIQNADAPPRPPAEGWDDDDDDFWNDESPLGTSAKENEETRHEDNDVSNWVYDPVTDIIPTRTRWVNPIPGPRDLRYM
jgi:hypothetical protein